MFNYFSPLRIHWLTRPVPSGGGGGGRLLFAFVLLRQYQHLSISETRTEDCTGYNRKLDCYF